MSLIRITRITLNGYMIGIYGFYQTNELFSKNRIRHEIDEKRLGKVQINHHSRRDTKEGK